MSTRHLIAAALLIASTCAAHADVLPATAAPAGTTTQSGYLSSWTAGNGTDVVSSGVLGNGTSLIGGVSYGSTSVAQALYEKASANQAGGQVKVAQGIDGSYLVGMSNAKIAALLGNSVSVVGSGDNITVTTGNNGAAAGGTSGGAVGGSAGGAVGGSTGGSTGPGGSTGDSGGGSTGGGSISVPGSGALDPITGDDTSGGNLGTDAPADNTPTAEVPEPSTIALMLAGMVGVASLSRRRQR